MTHRTPTSDTDQTQPLAARARVEALAADADPGEDDDTDDLTEPIPVWTAPQPGSYERRGANTKHRHDGDRDEMHYQGNLPHYHDPDSGILVFFDPAASAPNGAASEVDPIPATSSPSEAAIPDAGDASVATGVPSGPTSVGSGGAAGSGRPSSLERLRAEQDDGVAVVDVPYDPTHSADIEAGEDQNDPTGRHEAAGERSVGGGRISPTSTDHVHLTQFEALRVTTALSEVALRLGRPVLHAADKREMATAVLLIRDQLVARADQAHQAAWGIEEDGAR